MGIGADSISFRPPTFVRCILVSAVNQIGELIMVLHVPHQRRHPHFWNGYDRLFVDTKFTSYAAIPTLLKRSRILTHVPLTQATLITEPWGDLLGNRGVGSTPLHVASRTAQFGS